MKINAKMYVKNGRLEDYRNSFGFNMVEFADIVKIKIGRYRNIENLRVNPTEDEICIIASKLEQPIEILFPTEHEKVVDVVSGMANKKTIDYTPPVICGGEEVLLLDKINNEMTVERLVSILTFRERKVIELRNGLSGYNPMTLEKLAVELGVTRERIRQIEAKAHERIRQYSEELKLEY